MNTIERDINNADGTIETLIITSNDNYQTLDANKTYTLANNTFNKGNKIQRAFKNSILGAEIGVRAEGFTTIAILATIVAVGTICLMYAFWRI